MVMLGNGLDVITATAPRVDPQARKSGEIFNAAAEGKPGYKPPEELRPFRELPRIGLDIETVDPEIKTKGPGAHRKEGKVVGVAIAYALNDAVYYPTGHANRDRCMPNPEAFYRKLREEAAAFEGEIVGANLQYDLDWLAARHGIHFKKAKIRDVQMAEPLLDENKPSYKLDILARQYTPDGKYTDTLREKYGKDYISHMDQVDPGWAGEYAEQDTILPWKILDRQMIGLESEKLTDLYDLESRLVPLLLQMRQVGVRVDLEKAEQAREMTKVEHKAALARIKDISGVAVEVWAADSIARAFSRVGIDYPKTATGRPSFKKDWLAAHPSDLAKEIIKAREFDKIGSTFIESYILNGHVDGRLHCMFNPLRSDDKGTVSGRFSSSYPNLQNIPARHPVLGPLCRSIFIPEEGMLWGSADWSQIEYRFLVHYAHITKSIDASKAVAMYRNDPKTDFHAMAAELTGLPRKQSKNINFGVVYGMGVAKMASSLGVPNSEAEEILNTFHTKSPFIKDMLTTASARAASNGFIRTILGRRRRFAQYECNGKLFQGKDEALEYYHRTRGANMPRRAFTHKALNSLLQGSAADLMKQAMVEMYESGLFNILVPHLTVHDEMNVSVPDTKEGREAFEEMTRIMTSTMELAVPVLADANLGANWDEAK